MSRDDCLRALGLLQALRVRCREYQLHPPDYIHASSPWAIMARDKHGLRVDFHELAEVRSWITNYWRKP